MSQAFLEMQSFQCVVGLASACVLAPVMPRGLTSSDKLWLVKGSDLAQSDVKPRFSLVWLCLLWGYPNVPVLF